MLLGKRHDVHDSGVSASRFPLTPQRNGNGLHRGQRKQRGPMQSKCDSAIAVVGDHADDFAFVVEFHEFAGPRVSLILEINNDARESLHHVDESEFEAGKELKPFREVAAQRIFSVNCAGSLAG